MCRDNETRTLSPHLRFERQSRAPAAPRCAAARWARPLLHCQQEALPPQQLPRDWDRTCVDAHSELRCRSVKISGHLRGEHAAEWDVSAASDVSLENNEQQRSDFQQMQSRVGGRQHAESDTR